MTLGFSHPFERQLRVFFAGVLMIACASGAAAQGINPHNSGPQGSESGPSRRQEWLVPLSDPSMPSRALLFRPAGDGPFRLAVIAHASVQNPLRRAQMPQPEYRALATWLVSRGFAVIVPERSGHGATG